MSLCCNFITEYSVSSSELELLNESSIKSILNIPYPKRSSCSDCPSSICELSLNLVLINSIALGHSEAPSLCNSGCASSIIANPPDTQAVAAEVPLAQPHHEPSPAPPANRIGTSAPGPKISGFMSGQNEVA